jgi:hypothetical protein
MNLSLKEIARFMRMDCALPEGELAERVNTLVNIAPISPKKVWMRYEDKFLLCATIGSAFDLWQRKISLSSATDALIAQAIGAAAVEKIMDSLEEEIKASLSPSQEIRHRRSPGYPGYPISLNAEILSLLDAAKKIGVSTTDSMLLIPTKSVVAICEVIK